MKRQLSSFIVIAATSCLFACSNNNNSDVTTDSTTSTTGENNNQTARDTTTTTTNASTNNSDADFVSNTIAGNIAEIKLANLAQQKASSNDVKNLAKMLEQDHTKLLAQLKDYASKKNITAPTEEKQDAKDKYEELSKKSGKEFDKDFCDLMESKHKDGIAKFEAVANSSTADPELKTLANNALPKLRTHLDHVMQCKSKLK